MLLSGFNLSGYYSFKGGSQEMKFKGKKGNGFATRATDQVKLK